MEVFKIIKNTEMLKLNEIIEIFKVLIRVLHI